MLQAALFSLVSSVFLTSALVDQIQLNVVNPNTTREDWNLNKPSNNPNATDHLVFETVHSLLQHWPNTRMRNGHNIVPGKIPKGTLLYHGTGSNELPLWPEWVATDPEHAYLFCRVVGSLEQHEGCWQLTLTTTRPLKVIYFDGNSAAKLPYGSMDTQDLIAWGGPGDHDVWDERQRIQDLCKWGEEFGVDGFVRMEMDFEIMLCDFTSGVSIVSFMHLVSRGGTQPLMSDFLSFSVLDAGSWYNHFPGETRIQLDLAGLVSFYDAQLAPSLVDIRAGQERWDHRVQNISSEDFWTAKSRLETILKRPEDPSSGIDWRALIHVIVDRYAGRLELTRYLLDSLATTSDEILDLANKTQTQLRVMLTPYLLFSATPPNELNKDDLDWAIPIYKLCATTHTIFMESELDSMTDSEKLLLRAVRGTTQEICRVVTKMWAAGVYVGIDRLLNKKDTLDITELTRLRNIWIEDLNHLMGWLDWSVWVKCNPNCSPDEMCYLATWPVGLDLMDKRLDPTPSPHSGSNKLQYGRLGNFDLRAMVTEMLAEEARRIIQPDPDDWIRPQPRCIRRVDPYDFWYKYSW